MESWRAVWRRGLEPLLSDAALKALERALATDAPYLCQHATTTPPMIPGTTGDWPVEAACLIGLCGWKGEGLETVGEVDEYFARLCYEIDQRLGEPAGCRWILNHFDEEPRATFFPALLEEVRLSLATRGAAAVAAAG